MRFDSVVNKMKNEAELKVVAVWYYDKHYSIAGHYIFDERDISSHELIIELKNCLMDIFGKLENAENRILRKHAVNAIGKLNYNNFNHTGRNPGTLQPPDFYPF